MTSAGMDGKMIANALYHSSVITGLALGIARLGKLLAGGASPKLDFTPRDTGMILLDVTLAMAAKDILIKQGIIPADIVQ
jgi:hypothetical protein